jgi:hypothetical protein
MGCDPDSYAVPQQSCKAAVTTDSSIRSLRAVSGAFRPVHYSISHSFSCLFLHTQLRIGLCLLPSPATVKVSMSDVAAASHRTNVVYSYASSSSPPPARVFFSTFFLVRGNNQLIAGLRRKSVTSPWSLANLPGARKSLPLRRKSSTRRNAPRLARTCQETAPRPTSLSVRHYK